MNMSPRMSLLSIFCLLPFAFLGAAGTTIDMYDSSTYKYLRSITLDGDVTTQFYVVPRAAR